MPRSRRPGAPRLLLLGAALLVACSVGLVSAGGGEALGRRALLSRTTQPKGVEVLAVKAAAEKAAPAGERGGGAGKRGEQSAAGARPGGAVPASLQAADAGSAFWTAVWRSYVVILCLEIGDRTFFIAALMSAKHPAKTVFVGAFGALLVMTVLSTALGVAAPLLLPRSLTHWAGACLFLFYGVTMLLKAYRMPAAGEGPSEELGEVEDELKSEDAHHKYGALSKYLPPVLAQTFVMTFLAEWGDRSQIATISMGADYNALGICVGGSAGHATATALAVLGGRLMAAKISERSMGFAGGATFLLFGILACLEDPSQDITAHAVPSFLTWGKGT